MKWKISNGLYKHIMSSDFKWKADKRTVGRVVGAVRDVIDSMNAQFLALELLQNKEEN